MNFYTASTLSKIKRIKDSILEHIKIIRHEEYYIIQINEDKGENND